MRITQHVLDRLLIQLVIAQLWMTTYKKWQNAHTKLICQIQLLNQKENLLLLIEVEIFQMKCHYWIKFIDTPPFTIQKPTSC